MVPVTQGLAFANIETLVLAFLRGRSELTGIPTVARLPADYSGTSAATGPIWRLPDSANTNYFNG